MARPRMPEWLEPMAATLTQDRFTGADWLFERKFDGIRLLAYKRGGDVQLYLAQPPAAEHPGDREAIAATARRRRDPRRRSDVGSAQRLSRLRHPVARRHERDRRCRSKSAARC